MLRAMAEMPLRAEARSLPACGRRLAFVWLAVVLAILTFETGRHSVHHLDDDEAAACAVASTVGHSPLVDAPPVVVAPFTCAVASVVVDRTPLAPSARPLGLDHERAPPRSLSA